MLRWRQPFSSPYINKAPRWVCVCDPTDRLPPGSRKSLQQIQKLRWRQWKVRSLQMGRLLWLRFKSVRWIFKETRCCGCRSCHGLLGFGFASSKQHFRPKCINYTYVSQMKQIYNALPSSPFSPSSSALLCRTRWINNCKTEVIS